MRVAFIVPSLGEREGQGRANLVMLRALSGAGFEIDVWAGNAVAAAGLPGVTLHALPRLPVWQWGNQMLGMVATAARVRRARYDLVHADAAIAGVRADVIVVHTLTARWLDLPPSVWRRSGARGLNEAMATRFKARVEVAHARRARHVLANSRMTADDLVARGVAAAGVDVLPFGVDADHHRPPTDEERSAARARFGLERDAFVVGFVGPLGPRKGFDVLTRAVGGSDMTVLAAGDLREGRELQAARAAGSRVVAPGKVEDVREVYRAMDVLAYPSRYDSFGMAVLEAMASGVPVVVSAQTGAAEHVAQAGIVVEQPDPVAVAAALQQMRTDADARTRMGQVGRSIAEKRSWDETGARLLNVYKGTR